MAKNHRWHANNNTNHHKSYYKFEKHEKLLQIS